MSTHIRFAARGLLVWTVAILILRLLPPAVTDHPPQAMLFTAAVSAICLSPATLWMLRKQAPDQKPGVLGAFLAPQMLGDALAVAAFGAVLPNFPLGHAAPFGALVLWCYAVMLTTALVASRRRA
jgi:predicted MFS family arabinose efflux permease